MSLSSLNEAFLKGKLDAEAARRLETITVADYLRQQKLGKPKAKIEIYPMQPEPKDKPKQGKHTDRITPRARVRERKSYLSPAREDTVTIAAHAAPELKEALKKKFERSGFEHFNDFLVSGLQNMAQNPPEELKPTTELAETALTQSRELQKTISRLAQNLSTRTR